jgi:hypothetical protein
MSNKIGRLVNILLNRNNFKVLFENNNINIHRKLNNVPII